MAFLYVFLGGGLGAMARYAISTWIQVPDKGFPTATLLANSISCIILGVLMGIAIQKGLSNKMQWLAMTGFCGGFSTFSTFSAESFRLLEVGEYKTALLYILASLIVCLMGILLGVKLGTQISG